MHEVSEPQRPRSRRAMTLTPALVPALASALVLALLLGPTSQLAASDSGLEGIWKGMLVSKAAEVEAEILIEVGRTPEGDYAGTFDMPVQNYIFHPLDTISLEGSKVAFDFYRDSERRGKNARFAFEGELSEDGQKITGNVIDGDIRIPFHLTWTDPPGTPREEPTVPDVATMSDDGDKLRDAFNREQDHVRLVMTLSPT
ncbi:MAG: hypothetical protein AAF560_22710 [Acidobacteriota bacterium]